MIFPDTVSITPTTIDQTYGFIANGTAFDCQAYFENSVELKYGENGTPLTYDMLILLPFGTNIAEGYQIKPMKKRGVSLSGTRYMKVKSIEIAPMNSHLEVYV